MKCSGASDEICGKSFERGGLQSCGKPQTEWERDICKCFDKLEKSGLKKNDVSKLITNLKIETLFERKNQKFCILQSNKQKKQIKT